jgi:hypothetical protein
MKTSDFLEAKDFTFAEGKKLETFDCSKLETFSDINLDTIKFVKSEALDGLLESSAISDKTDTPSTPSFQPLNEAGILTSGEALNKSSIGALTNNSLGVQEDAMESLENTAKLADGTSVNPTKETLERMKEAQETLATGVKSLANGAEFANSGIKFGGGSLQFAGNNISLGSDTSVHMTSPIITSVSDVDNRQAKTIQETTNQKTTIAKSTFTQIEGLQSTVAGNSMKTVTEANIQVSNFSSNTAIEKSITNSNQIENVAGSYIKNRSQNAIANEATSIISSQSPNISITAAEGSKSSLAEKQEISNNGGGKNGLTLNKDGTYNVSAQDATGRSVEFKNISDAGNAPLEKWKSIGGLEGESKDKAKPTVAKQGKGNLSILADGDGGTVSIINKNMIMSSTSNQNITVGGNYNQVAKGSITSSGAFVNTEADAGLTMSGKGYIRTQSGTTGTFISNGFTFAGYKFPSLKKFIDKARNVPLEIREIPALSPFPLAIGVKDLQDCLPKKYKKEETPEDTLNPQLNKPDKTAAPSLEEVRQREKSSAIPTGKTVSNAEGGILDSSTTNSSKKIDGNTMLSKDNAPTDQTAVPKNKLTSAAAIFKGGGDVYPLDNEEAFDLFVRQGKEIIDPDAGEESGGQELTKDLIISLSKLSLTNTSILLNSKPEILTLLNEDLAAIKNYFFNKLITDKSLITEEYKYTDKQKEFIEKALKIEGAKQFLDRIETELISRSSIGGAMSFITTAYNNVSSSVSIASNILEQAKDKNEFAVLKSASELAKNLSKDEIFTDINRIINSSSSLSNIYGQVNNLINNKDGAPSEVTDKVILETIENIVSEGLNIIGIDKLEKATNIAQILTSIKNSEEYKKSGLTTKVKKDLIFRIVNEAGIEYTEAESIYNQAEDVIANILEGNINSLVEGSELQNLLGYFIGASNAAVLTDIKDIYLKGQSAVNKIEGLVTQGTSLYQDGKDLYSTIQTIPALVGLMNEYEIPLLNQAKIVLQCLDLINKVKGLIGGVKQASKSINEFGNLITDTFDAFNDLVTTDKKPNISPLETITEGLIKGEIAASTDLVSIKDNLELPILLAPYTNNPIIDNNLIIDDDSIVSTPIIINNTEVTKDTCSTIIYSAKADTNDSTDPSQWTEDISDLDAIELIEKLPRLTQIYNSIKELPLDNAISVFPELSNNQIETIQNTEIIVETNNCFIAPKLNLAEASITVIEIKDNVMLYKMSYPEILTYNSKDIYPSNNVIVQIYVEEFLNNKTGETMTIIKNKEFFSPYIYSFKTTVFDKEKNLGIAYLMNSQSRIHLQSSSIPYNYSITDIGRKLSPFIKDAYIVA